MNVFPIADNLHVRSWRTGLVSSACDICLSARLCLLRYLKKLCGMQDVSDAQENAELEACTRREVCGRGLAPQESGNRTLRQKRES